MKLKFIAAILATLFLFSCSPSKKDLIIGKWKETGEGSSVFEYKKDGTYFCNFDDGKTEEGTYRVEGSTLYNTIKGESTESAVKLGKLDDENMSQIIGS